MVDTHSQYRKARLLSRVDEEALALEYRRTHDPKIAERLIEANLRLVAKLARSYSSDQRDLPDLIQEGTVGLIRAVHRFDPERSKLSTYAAWWIRAYQLKWLLSNHRLVKIGSTQAQRKIFFNMRGTQAKLAAAGASSDAHEVARVIGVPEREVETMMSRLAAPDLSLADPVSDQARESRLDRLADGHDPVDELFAQREIESIANAEVDRLRMGMSARDRMLLEERWLSETPSTLEGIGKRMGVSRERARQLEERMLGNLRRQVASRLEPHVAV